MSSPSSEALVLTVIFYPLIAPVHTHTVSTVLVHLPKGRKTRLSYLYDHLGPSRRQSECVNGNSGRADLEYRRLCSTR